MRPLSSFVEDVVKLANVEERRAVAQSIAGSCGADEMLFFVRDPELGIPVPAPGFAGTVRGGPAWREFLRMAVAPGTHRGDVDLRGNTKCPALAFTRESLTVIAVGSEIDEASLQPLFALTPLIAALFDAEKHAGLAEARANAAEHEAGATQTLIQSLDTTRADARQLNARLTAEHERRDDFLAMLGHELRNPISPMVTAVELMRRGGPAMFETQLGVMERQLRQMSGMIDDLLDMSRVRLGKINLRRLPCRVAEIVHGAVEAITPMLDARRQSLTVHMGDELWVDVDLMRMVQVLSNLLHNASKYTDAGGHVDLTIRCQGRHAVFQMTDNGIGMDPDVLPRIFDLFTQAPVALARSQGGLGIGLTLVRSIVELHGGMVSARSEGLGTGSTFEVSLPLTTPPESSVVLPHVTPHVTPHVAPDAATGCSSLSILVVDDNLDLAESMGSLLSLMGHRATTAHDGFQALQVARYLQPDIILLDIGLPGMDGYQVCGRLRRMLPDTAVLIAMTGYGSPDDRRRALEAGFDEHLVKPVAHEQLERTLARMSRSSR